jgi:hypothetical protein
LNTSEQIATSDRDPQSELSTEDYTDDDEYSTFEEEEDQLSTGLDQEDNDENETSNDQYSTDEDENSSSSEDDEYNDPVIPVNVLTDPALIRIRLLIKQVRELVGLVRQSSNLHEYIRQQKKEKQLPGDVSNEW